MSDQFVVCTDSHLANQPPRNRIDNYNQSILAKIEWVRDYCLKKKVNRIIFSGDLCHTHRTNDELIYRFVELFAGQGIDIYYLLGNHDIQGANTNFIQKTNMGLLTHYEWFHLLDVKEPYEFKNCYLTGLDYSVKGETKNAFYWWEGNRIKEAKDQRVLKQGKHMILATHAMITNETMVIKGEAKSVAAEDVDTNADLLINGHYHVGHKGVVTNTVLEHTFKIINPGSIARMNLAEAEESHGPRIAHLRLTKNKPIKIKFVKIPCKSVSKIFDRHAIGKAKDFKVSHDKFIDSVKALSKQDVMGDNFESTLKKLLKKPPKKLKKIINSRVRKTLMKKLEEHNG